MPNLPVASAALEFSLGFMVFEK